MRFSDSNGVVLLILDGWALSPEDSYGDAILHADTPNWDRIWEECPSTELITHGREVGLVEGQMGNSEVGHLNLGAGRLVKQEILRINEMIESGEFFEHPALTGVTRAVNENDSTLHLMGLVSDGGVHSHLDHLLALLKLARREGLENVAVHALLDGRDTPPKSAEQFLEPVAEQVARKEGWRIATLGGRYYGMDRDENWEREKRAWDAVVHGKGRASPDWENALDRAYESGESDEFVTPTVIGGEYGGVRDGDGFIFFNFRSDRARQFTHALLDADFEGFDRGARPEVEFASLKRYEDDLDNPTLLEENHLENTATEVLSERGYKVFKTAETEKYAHVTYFFNGGREEPFDNERRVVVKSPHVDTYDLLPQMSIYPVTAALKGAITCRSFALAVCNFANPDMVGHTGDFEAAVEACEHVDDCLGDVIDICGRHDYDLVVTADHGNAEQMKLEDGSVSTQHSKNPAPFVLVGERLQDYQLKEPGGNALRDVIPTCFELIGEETVAEMDGKSLILSQ